ncbi:MAG: hypothetical protein U0451_00900 [Candidatus Saccharimonadales bacterium]
MGFGIVFLGIMGLFLWAFVVYWIIKTRKQHHQLTAQDKADDDAAERALEAEEGKIE